MALTARELPAAPALQAFARPRGAGRLVIARKTVAEAREGPAVQPRSSRRRARRPWPGDDGAQPVLPGPDPVRRRLRRRRAGRLPGAARAPAPAVSRAGSGGGPDGRRWGTRGRGGHDGARGGRHACESVVVDVSRRPCRPSARRRRTGRGRWRNGGTVHRFRSHTRTGRKVVGRLLWSRGAGPLRRHGGGRCVGRCTVSTFLPVGCGPRPSLEEQYLRRRGGRRRAGAGSPGRAGDEARAGCGGIMDGCETFQGATRGPSRPSPPDPPRASKGPVSEHSARP